MDLLEFIGHFHPVLVHLPIGILLVAILFEWLSHRKGFRKIRKSTRLLFLLGFLTALASSGTGYLLSLSGDYDAQLLSRHQWLGFIVTGLSLIISLLSKSKQRELRVAYGVLVFVLAILLLLTGHAGGSLTHGTDYLNPPAPADWFGVAKRDNLFLKADLKSAFFYKDLIAPLLNEKCVRCHGPSKQKGKLRLDKPEFILKGGKDGPVIQSTHEKSGSEIVRRIQLDLTDEDHMPPKEKNQLSKEEIDLVVYWIGTGFNFERQLAAMPGADSVIGLLAGQSKAGTNDPIPQVAMPDEKEVEDLKAGGVVVSFLAQGNGLVSLNFVNADASRIATLLNKALSIRQQTWELKLVGCSLSHQDWSKLTNLHVLHRLNLENSNIADLDLKSLRPLQTLQYLNLAGTAVTISGIKDLGPLPALRNMFLYHSGVRKEGFSEVKRLFPETVIDTGNYYVPMLPADTTELTKPYADSKI